MKTKKTVKNKFVDVIVYNETGILKTHCFPLDCADAQLFITLNDMENGEKAFMSTFEFTATGSKNELTRVFCFEKSEYVTGAQTLKIFENLKNTF